MILEVVFTRGYLKGNKSQQERILRIVSEIRTKWDANPRPNPNSVESQQQIDPSLAKYCSQHTHVNPQPSVASSVSYYGSQSSANTTPSLYRSIDCTIDNSSTWMKVK
jgi:hypothetical protein